mmetsp:Transcript_30128/g.47945  ORF Transcript_30128/g.47945 Transcript_30128/m.47945 type:complete len:475 (+) Transcript_30128:2396-3820(+)
MVTFADGRTVQTSSDGVVIEIQQDGTKKQTNADGSTIVLRPDGTREQIYASGVSIKIHQDGTVKVSSREKNGSKEEEISKRIIQTLSVFSDGSQVQVNHQGYWRLLLKESDGSVIQKGPEGTFLKVSPDNVATLVQHGKQVDNLVLKETVSSAQVEFETKCNLSEPVPTATQADLSKQLEEELLTKCTTAEKLTRATSVREIEHRLVLSERSMEINRLEYERLAVDLQERAKTETTRSRQLASQLGHMKEQYQALQESFEVEKQRYLAKPSQVETSTTGTQWSSSNTQTKYYETNTSLTEEFKEEDGLYNDPDTSRIIIASMQNRIVELELERQSIEDALIDLRLSCPQKKKKKKGPFARLIPSIIVRQKRATKTCVEQSLEETVELLRHRATDTSGQLAEKSRELLKLANELQRVKTNLTKTAAERDMALEACAKLENKQVGLHHDSNQLELLPPIEEETKIQIELCPISPML